MKRCSQCKTEKDESEFNKSSKEKSGLKSNIMVKLFDHKREKHFSKSIKTKWRKYGNDSKA